MDRVPATAKSPTDAERPQETDARKNPTPIDLNIQCRNRHFASAVIERRRWIGGDPYASAFFNCLSAIFPKGEALFIEVLKKYRDRTPPKLQGEIRSFIQQEATHSREHHFFNQHLASCDLDISRLEESISNVVSYIRAQPEIIHLVATMCIEHITAILAAEVIANPRHFEHADEEQRKLWLWHSSEEVEHKGVAYDTWLHITRDWNPLKRWYVRSAFMAKISLGFTINRTRGVIDLLRQDGITGFRAWIGLAHYALVGPAPLRRTIWPWLQFFKPGFHPWDIDDRHLIQLAESEYEAAIMDQPPVTVAALVPKDAPVEEYVKKVA
ncbi:metal-dependent hydrolase [Parasphingorhabdus flavimaris]|uniref:metal-dependent hydrolase n=1 Tax=Parasphingorhabdus flavimaris TaxID=266812 RepID=UPI00300228FB|tara:strand:+ start:5658 stop:6635 length:978 start_codon:yes stop_codon:yes gene_type:complete